MPESTDIEIYVFGRNAVDAPSYSVFRQIQAGAAASLFDLGVLKDSTGDNISKRQPFYGEITLMYWAWKNTQNQSYVGFFNHQNFLDLNRQNNSDEPGTHLGYSDFSQDTCKKFGWTEELVKDACNEADILVPLEEVILHPLDRKSPATLYEQYASTLIVRDLDLAIEAAERVTDPKSVVRETLNRNQGVLGHTFIMKREIFDHYMTWLFEIFSQLGDKINLDMPIYQNSLYYGQVYSSLAKRLLNVFLELRKMEGSRISHHRVLSLRSDKNYPEAQRSYFNIARTILENPHIKRIPYGFRLHALGCNIDIYKPY